MVLTKVSRTFPVRLDFELNKAFNAICVRHGDVTYHIEQALLDYKPIKKALGGKTLAVKRSQGFVKPELTELAMYFADRGCTYGIDQAESFYDFYQSKGWKVGKNPMKDWKAAVRNWLKRSNGDAKDKRSNQGGRSTGVDRVRAAGVGYLARKEAESQGDAKAMGSNAGDLREQVQPAVRGGTERGVGETIDGDYSRSDS